eukprot:TRINITY_DN77890_c0_g1_i1.p1 TRINITY_DN77890_c0_g1~~TRINITY_DN77890_c0_g1_i1.p1  ORF type:complete len:373 (-),score=52.85 TRINITY_DN77890_c0_g1_i1:108-1226(-)
MLAPARHPCLPTAAQPSRTLADSALRGLVAFQGPVRMMATAHWCCSRTFWTLSFATVVASLRRRCSRSQLLCTHPFQSVEIAGKGIGVIATRDIAEGELVLSESPLLTWSVEASTEVGAAGASLCEVVPEEVLQTINGLSDASKQRLLSLHDRFADGGPKTLLGILSTNGFSHSDGLMILCEATSRFNHSCCPNCESTFYDGADEKQIYASRAIQEGEELCIPYIDVRVTRQERQDLLDMWGFRCSCEACSSPDAESDMRRARMRQLNPDKGSASSFQEPEVAIESVLELLKLYGEESLPSQQHRKRACQQLFQFSLQASDLLGAEKWLAQALQHAEMCQAADHSETELMRGTLKTLQEKIEQYMPGASGSS